jgi:hypothetical protein
MERPVKKKKWLGDVKKPGIKIRESETLKETGNESNFQSKTRVSVRVTCWEEKEMATSHSLSTVNCVKKLLLIDVI